ncbi:hypothetical protein ACI7BZ_20035 [Xanthobacter sp. AM11]|uniref:hypothetical protein n=1 Tax=Xanthobacter sp. AM11 TaxID=3380643 RepID=UPI0039BF46DB
MTEASPSTAPLLHTRKAARRLCPARPRPAGCLAAGLLAACLLAAPAAAQSAAAGAKGDTSCAQYGPGFQKAPGSDSCVRMRSGVRVDGFAGGALTSAPGQGNSGATSLGSTAEPQPVDPWKTPR